VQRLEVSPGAVTEADLSTAVAWLRAGRVVAYPTDTLYGLAVDPASEAAVAALFELKGRGSSAAIPLIAASLEQVDRWCALSPASRRLAEACWPGPLSLICDAPPAIVPAVHAGLGTIAIRVPAHRVARTLAAAFGSPITATSANRSGHPAADRAEALVPIANDRLLVVDGGATAGGAPSTIVDARSSEPTLVREGAIPWSRVLHSLERR
jgi:L-threonylcarbamoyladenylate synthase